MNLQNSSGKIKMKHQNRSLLLLLLIVFTAGFLFYMNDILSSLCITQFKLNFIQTPMIQITFYLTYIVITIPIVWMIHRFGYKISLLVAEITLVLGCSDFLRPKQLILLEQRGNGKLNFKIKIKQIVTQL